MLVLVCPGQGSQTPGFLAPWLELAGRRASGSTALVRRRRARPRRPRHDVRRRRRSATPRSPSRSSSPPACVAAAALFPAATTSTPRPVRSPGHCVGEITAAAARRGPHRRRRAGLRPHARPGDGRGQRRHPDRHERGARRRPRRGASPTLERTASPRPTSTAPARSSPPARSSSSPPSRPTRRPRPGSSPSRSPARSTPLHMAPAVEALAEPAARPHARRPRACPCCPTPTAPAVADGAEVLARLVGQVSNPVRWDLCMETFAELGVTGLDRARARRHAGRPGQARACRASRPSP